MRVFIEATGHGWPTTSFTSIIFRRRRSGSGSRARRLSTGLRLKLRRPSFLPCTIVSQTSAANLFRRSLYYGGRLLPRGVDTPLALNLLAFGQKPA